MIQEVKRNYLEINSLQDLKESKLPLEDYSLELLDPINFQLNKFFYKNIGKKHNLSIVFLTKLVGQSTYDFYQYFYKKIYLIENYLDLTNLKNNC